MTYKFIKYLIPFLIVSTLLSWRYIHQVSDNLQYSQYELLGKISAAKSTDFVKINPKYIAGDRTIYLRKEVYTAFKTMYDSAKSCGIELKLISGFRSFEHQKRIWEGKWDGKIAATGLNFSDPKLTDVKKAQIILQYSSMPGISRHHWGTDIDILDLNPKFFETPKGKKAYNWLKTNAKNYGFCQPYTAFDSIRNTGFWEEKWHWSYFPISDLMLKEYQRIIKYSDISGFKGSWTADSLKVIENYVFSISEDCK
ncbi:MAG: M15 family metallopeptidase [Bacteroidales bacterium]|nr:M15 family metallopeptidase [Bacteroidales bacterium]